MSRAVAAPGSVLLVAAVMLVPGTATANPADAFGLGPRIPAMGGAGTAATDDTAAGYYNPAAFGFFEHLRLDLGYQYAQPELEIGGRNVGVDASRGMSLGVVVPGKIGPVSLGLGGTFFLPDGYYSRTRALAGGQPRFQLYDNRPQRFLFSFNLGLSYGDWLAIGGGLTYMSGTSGEILLRGRVGFPDASDSELTQGFDVDVETIPYPQLGMMIKATDWLTFGASYRGEFELDLDLTLDIRGSIGGRDQEQVVEDGFFVVNSASRDLFQPAQFTVGAAAQVTSDLLVTVDLGYHRWSSFNNPATVIDIDLDVGTFNEDIDITEAPPFPAPNFDDIWVPRVGAEYRAFTGYHVSVDVRGGYAYEPSPAPEQTDENNFVDNDKHTVSVGAGALLKEITEIVPLPFSIDAYFSFTVLPERTHRKMSAADPVGDYSADGTVWNLGLGSRWSF